MTAIHQFVPSLAARDALGAHSLQVQRLLHDLGYRSEIYVTASHLEGRTDVHPYQSYPEHRTAEPTWLLYQASIGSPIARFLGAQSEPKIVNYHNVTPPEFYEPWEPTVTAALASGLRQMEELAPTAALAIADSEFNEQDLARLGYRSTAVVPILFDPGAFDVAPDPVTEARLGEQRARGGSEWLFVGRMCPNKAQHDLVKAFATYRLAYDPAARLCLVGGSSSHLYESAVEQFAREVGCAEAITFAGSVSGAALSAYYGSADVFVCLSRHEGFCVPLLEAMHRGVPVVALRSTAVPETLGGAGLLVPSAAPAVVAAAVDRVCTDPDVRSAMVAAGRRRVLDFALDASRDRLAAVVRDLCGAP